VAAIEEQNLLAEEDLVLPLEQPQQLPQPQPAQQQSAADLQQLSQALASTQLCLWLAAVAMLVLGSVQVAVLLVLGVVLLYRSNCRSSRYSTGTGIVDARLEALL
jgi:Flp pilus assembly protein TadB